VIIDMGKNLPKPPKFDMILCGDATKLIEGLEFEIKDTYSLSGVKVVESKAMTATEAVLINSHKLKIKAPRFTDFDYTDPSKVDRKVARGKRKRLYSLKAQLAKFTRCSTRRTKTLRRKISQIKIDHIDDDGWLTSMHVYDANAYMFARLKNIGAIA